MTDRNYQKPNWVSDGKLYLLRCYECDKEYGRENYMLAVSSGKCAWCGWEADKLKEQGG